MARGGRRAGTAGKAYTNRTDLNTNRAPVNPLAVTRTPVTAPVGGVYGEQKALVNAQQQTPTIPAGTSAAAPTPPGPAAPGAPAGPGGPPLSPNDLAQTVPNIDDPTGNPNEHVMTPPNPAAGLDQVAQQPALQAVAALNRVGDISPQVKALRATLNAQLANQAAP